MTETYDFSVEVDDGEAQADLAVQLVVTYVIPTDASIMTISGQIIDEGTAFDSIDLDDYLTTVGDISIYWAVTGGTDLKFALDDQNVWSVSIPNEDWFGKELFTISLHDTEDDELLDQLSLAYEVLNINDAPTAGFSCSLF